jgi:predicted  nucleic acid-binding Zn-ribbon protein
MIETMEAKAKFETALDKARGLHPLRQARERLALELGNLPYNFVRLEMAGRTLADEKQRIEGEIGKLRERESGILQELRDFFVALVKDATEPVHKQIAEAMSKRLRLRDLLSEAATIYAEVEQVQKNWTPELDRLRKVATELKNETKEGYELPEISFPSLPSPSVQQTVRMRDRADNLAEILSGMAKQIA